MERSVLLDKMKRYTSVVVWGLRESTTSTQRHVHRHMYDTLRKIGVPAVWCENENGLNSQVPDGSLVITSEQCCSQIQYRKSNWYALFHTVHHIAECRNYVMLRVYGDSEPGEGVEHWSKTAMFHKASHKLWQTYGTDLLPEEFQPPVFCSSNVMNWVGSIWEDKKGHGNIRNIENLKKALERHGLRFIHHQDVSDEVNMAKVRESRIAPAIGGHTQMAEMMPCRIWKNISYGQLGVTNLARSVEVFGSDIVYSPDLFELVDLAMSVGEEEYRERTARQQEIVAAGHTYLDWLYNVVRALEELGDQ